MPKFVKHCLENKSNALVSVRPDESVEKVLELMRDKLVRSVLVMDFAKLVGIISQGDCVIKVLLPGLSATEVNAKEIMTHNPLAVGFEDSLDDCMQLMISKRIRHLPVLVGDEVRGIVSVGDVIKIVLGHKDVDIKFLERYKEVWCKEDSEDGPT